MFRDYLLTRKKPIEHGAAVEDYTYLPGVIELWFDDVAEYPTEYAPPADDDGLQVLTDILSRVKSTLKTVQDLKKKKLEPVKDLEAWLNAEFATRLNNLTAAESALKATILNYNRAKQMERAREEARLRDEARQREEAAQMVAEHLRQEGKQEEAMQVEMDAMFVPTALPTPAKPDGIHTRSNWKGEVKDFRAFVEWCWANQRLDLLQVNQTALNAFAKSTIGKVSVNGVRFYDDAVLVARG